MTYDPAAAAADLGIAGRDDLRYRCLAFPFALDLLNAPGSDETAPTRDAKALRTYLASPAAQSERVPASGWHLVGVVAGEAEYVTVRQTGSGPEVHGAIVKDGWRVSSGLCQPELQVANGVGIASWEQDPDAPQAGPTTRLLHLVVNERTCSSGQPPGDRILAPALLRDGELLHLVFGVRAREGVSTCQGAPGSRVRVDLGEELGDRTLIDPSLWPPAVRVRGGEAAGS